MSVKRSELDNPERGQAADLTNRDAARGDAGPPPRGADQVAQDVAAVKGKRPPTPEEVALRLERARALEVPQPAHCSHCAQAWTDGRDAAVRTVTGG